jgi:hypothetical protein
MAERKYVRLIDAALKAYEGVRYYRPVPSVYGKRHVDYIVCAYGYYADIEAKDEGLKETEIQYDALKKTEAAGGATFVINDYRSILKLYDWLQWCHDHPVKFDNWPTIPDRKVEVLE